MVSKESDDRLSSLPDEVLCHILSFLPTKLSVATSILATRYRFLWRNVPNLDFDSEEHEISPVHGMSFAHVISTVLLLTNVRKLNSFRLTVKDERFDIAHLLETWITNIIDRNVQALYIELCDQSLLPHCLFTCETLVDLRLHSCQGIIPDSIFLPNLKTLHLRHFQYGQLQNLISLCPVLEELYLFKRIGTGFERCTNISSPTIKSLILNFRFSDEYLPDYKLVINTPAVKYFSIVDMTSLHISAGIFNSVVDANVCLYNRIMLQNGNSISTLEFVEKLCHVKCLKLSLYYHWFADSALAAATWKFSNLTRLELAGDWHLLLKLLGSADKLQVLIILETRNALKRWTEPEQVATCLLSHLRQVKVHSFECLEAEFKMIRYILKHGEVLNMMKVYADIDCDTKKHDALRRISLFERRSQTCKLMFF